jgi:hypothetical protein
LVLPAFRHDVIPPIMYFVKSFPDGLTIRSGIESLVVCPRPSQSDLYIS